MESVATLDFHKIGFLKALLRQLQKRLHRHLVMLASLLRHLYQLYPAVIINCLLLIRFGAICGRISTRAKTKLHLFLSRTAPEIITAHGYTMALDGEDRATSA